MFAGGQLILLLLTSGVTSGVSEVLSKLSPLTTQHLKEAGQGFDVERSLRVQAALFREDLVWMNRGYTERQLNLMVFVAVTESMKKAEKRRDELDLTDQNDRAKLENIKLFLKAAEFYLEREVEKLKDLKDWELDLYY